MTALLGEVSAHTLLGGFLLGGHLSAYNTVNANKPNFKEIEFVKSSNNSDKLAKERI